MPRSHTTTEQWQSFEFRMRRRRAERCVLRATMALEAGVPDAAREALDEALALDPDNPGIPALLEQVAAAEFARVPPRRSRSRQAPAAAAAVILISAGTGWWSLRAPVGVPPQAAEHSAAGITVPSAGPPPSERPVRIVQSSVVVSDARETQSMREARAGTTGVQLAMERRAPGLGAAMGTAEPVAASREPPASAPAEPPPAPPSEPVALASAERASSGPLALSVPPVAPPAPAEPAPAPAARSGSGAAPSVARAGADALGSGVAGPAPPPLVPDERLVLATLNRYQTAYSRLDADAAGAVWPSVDRRALERAFGGLTSQTVSLDDCDVRVDGGSARADCTGRARWTQRVGGGTQTASRQWSFDLKNAGGDWVIIRANVR